MTPHNTKDTKNNKKIIISYHKNFFGKAVTLLKTQYVVVVLSMKNNLRDVIVKGKGKTEKLKQNNLIYKIPCKHCDASYVGNIKSEINTRINKMDPKQDFSKISD